MSSTNAGSIWSRRKRPTACTRSRPAATMDRLASTSPADDQWKAALEAELDQLSTMRVLDRMNRIRNTLRSPG